MNTTHTLRRTPRRLTTTVTTALAAAAVLAAAACGNVEAPAQDLGNSVREAPAPLPNFPYAPGAVAPPKDTSSYPYAPDAVAPHGLDDRTGMSHGFQLRKQSPDTLP